MMVKRLPIMEKLNRENSTYHPENDPPIIQKLKNKFSTYHPENKFDSRNDFHTILA
jgi:hypothetical protein